MLAFIKPRWRKVGRDLWLNKNRVVIILAAIASFLPAWNASRLTVQEVLAYE